MVFKPMKKIKNNKNISSSKSAVIVIMKEEAFTNEIEGLFDFTPWENKFHKNFYIYLQKKKPDFKEAIFVSKIILDGINSKKFDEVYIGFASNNNKGLNMLEILPVGQPLSFLIPKYMNSIIYGILLDAFGTE